MQFVVVCPVTRLLSFQSAALLHPSRGYIRALPPSFQSAVFSHSYWGFLVSVIPEIFYRGSMLFFCCLLSSSNSTQLSSPKSLIGNLYSFFPGFPFSWEWHSVNLDSRFRGNDRLSVILKCGIFAHVLKNLLIWFTVIPKVRSFRTRIEESPHLILLFS